MRELQDRAKHLQYENDRLQAQVEKRRNLGGTNMQDSDQARHPTTRDKGKEPIIPDDVDTPADDELSLGSSPNLSQAKQGQVASETLTSPYIQHRR